jgi:hypothetical protein
MTRSKAVQSAQICVFPPERHRTIVAFVVGEMLKQASPDAAEEYLIDHLNIEWGRLSLLGIADAEKDRQCRGFARAAWRAFFKDHDAMGAA